MGTKKWLGTWPAVCDICSNSLKYKPKFYDARTKRGPWALMCPFCYAVHGVGVGIGKGQEYDSVTLEKINGQIGIVLCRYVPWHYVRGLVYRHDQVYSNNFVTNERKMKDDED